MSSALLATRALGSAVEVGALGFREARGLFRETWQKAFPEYDVEKVFFRCVYTIGGLLIADAVYNVYFQFQLLSRKPLKWLTQVVEAPLKLFVTPISVQLAKTVFPKRAGEIEEEYRKRIEQERRQLCEDAGVPVILDDVFGKHFYLIMAGACGWWIFSEYRAYKKLKALTQQALAE